ncbi:MAG: response regulator [Bacillota bacterium]|nr:response regulator [Bacillota bacterium]
MGNVQFSISHADILILGNSSSYLINFAKLLKEKGYNVKNYDLLETALQSAKENLPDLILLDINMAESDGYKACQILKSDENLRNIPIIFIIPEGSLFDRKKIFAFGGTDYITAPFNYDEAFARIEMQMKLKFMNIENNNYKISFKNLQETNKELKEQNDAFTKSLQWKTKQLEDITADLKEFNVLLEEEISERTKTEEALKESESQFRHAVEESPVPMMLYTEDGEIIKISRAWSDVTGYTIKDTPTTSKFKEITKLVKEELVDTDEVTVFKDGQKSGVYSIKARDGNVRIFNFYSSYIGKLQDGRSLLSKVGIDVTEKKRLVELKEYDKIKTEFFSNISHELRTPINVIFSALQVLELKIKDYSSQNLSADKYTKIMKQNCYRLLRLINNLIDITKIDSGYYDINKKNVDIVRLIENITMSVADYIETKGLSLKFDTSVEEKVIACDAEKIERIILNLLSNAVKFTSSGGKITVNIEDFSEYISISVKDTGRGIPADKLNSIFERFVQVDKSLARDNEGSGIGLSLVKCLVELQGGTISVKSKERYGSEFIIKFPCQLVDEASDETSGSGSMVTSSIEKINIEFSDIYS